jgi:hypothetical protein
MRCKERHTLGRANAQRPRSVNPRFCSCIAGLGLKAGDRDPLKGSRRKIKTLKADALSAESSTLKIRELAPAEFHPVAALADLAARSWVRFLPCHDAPVIRAAVCTVRTVLGAGCRLIAAAGADLARIKSEHSRAILGVQRQAGGQSRVNAREDLQGERWIGLHAPLQFVAAIAKSGADHRGAGGTHPAGDRRVRCRSHFLKFPLLCCPAIYSDRGATAGSSGRIVKG